MTKNLLVELGLELAYVVTSEKQLGEKIAFLDDSRLSYESIQTFSTPRRLAVRVIGLARSAISLTEDFKGLKVARMQMETSQKQLKDSSVGKVWQLMTSRIPWSGKRVFYVTKHSWKP